MQIEFQILDALQKIHTPVLDGVMLSLIHIWTRALLFIYLNVVKATMSTAL